MSQTLTHTNFHLPHQTGFYRGKVRDVYTLGSSIVMVATDRISAFDIVLPQGIQHKGQILNQLAAYFLDATQDICQNWKEACPHPMVTIGKRCEGFPVEMIVRGYLCGSAWREYRKGMRNLCGVQIADGMRENERFVQPILTPTTKAEQGMHDENISRTEIVSRGMVSAEHYKKLEDYALRLFERGTQIAAERGLILVDTKYEFGLYNGEIYLMDEVHTPDSSRYFYADDYDLRFAKNEQPRQLSKEFVREWLMSNGFSGQAGQQMPAMTADIVQSITARYVELYEHLTGKKFIPEPYTDIENAIKLIVVSRNDI